MSENKALSDDFEKSMREVFDAKSGALNNGVAAEASTPAVEPEPAQEAEVQEKALDKGAKPSADKPASAKPSAEKPAKTEESDPAVSAASADAPDPDTTDDDPGPAPLRHWSQRQKDDFNELPPKGRELILDRWRYLDREANKKFEEASKLKREASTGSEDLQAYNKAMKRYEGDLARVGMTPLQAAPQVMELWQGLLKDPAGTMDGIVDEFLIKRGAAGSPLAAQIVRQLASKLRVSIDGLDAVADDGPAQAPTTSHETAEMARLIEENATLRNEFNEFRESFQSKEKESNERIFNDFMAKTPHAERVRDQIYENLALKHVQAQPTPAERLNKAYEIAAWADPEIRESLLAEREDKARQDAKATALAEAEAQRARLRSVPVAAARAASTAPRTVQPTVSANLADLELGDHLKATFNQLAGNGASRI